jgi:hypothetical protein
VHQAWWGWLPTPLQRRVRELASAMATPAPEISC